MAAPTMYYNEVPDLLARVSTAAHSVDGSQVGMSQSTHQGILAQRHADIMELRTALGLQALCDRLEALFYGVDSLGKTQREQQQLVAATQDNLEEMKRRLEADKQFHRQELEAVRSECVLLRADVARRCSSDAQQVDTIRQVEASLGVQTMELQGLQTRLDRELQGLRREAQAAKENNDAAVEALRIDTVAADQLLSKHLDAVASESASQIRQWQNQLQQLESTVYSKETLASLVDNAEKRLRQENDASKASIDRIERKMQADDSSMQARLEMMTTSNQQLTETVLQLQDSLQAISQKANSESERLERVMKSQEAAAEVRTHCQELRQKLERKLEAPDIAAIFTPLQNASRKCSQGLQELTLQQQHLQKNLSVLEEQLQQPWRSPYRPRTPQQQQMRSVVAGGGPRIATRPHGLGQPKQRPASARTHKATDWVAISPTQVVKNTLFEVVDSNRDGMISRSEFNHAHGCTVATNVVFDTLDQNRDGYIAKHEYKAGGGSTLASATAFNAIDMNHDGVITKEEFNKVVQINDADGGVPIEMALGQVAANGISTSAAGPAMNFARVSRAPQ